MAKDNPHITSENITEWMASTGFIFPRTVVELARFEKLHADVNENLEGCQVDPEVILGRKQRSTIIVMETRRTEAHSSNFKMAARKGDSNIPQHILDKIKINQEKRKQDDSGPQKGSTE